MLRKWISWVWGVLAVSAFSVEGEASVIDLEGRVEDLVYQRKLQASDVRDVAEMILDATLPVKRTDYFTYAPFLPVNLISEIETALDTLVGPRLLHAEETFLMEVALANLRLESGQNVRQVFRKPHWLTTVGKNQDIEIVQAHGRAISQIASLRNHVTPGALINLRAEIESQERIFENDYIGNGFLGSFHGLVSIAVLERSVRELAKGYRARNAERDTVPLWEDYAESLASLRLALKANQFQDDGRIEPELFHLSSILERLHRWQARLNLLDHLAHRQRGAEKISSIYQMAVCAVQMENWVTAANDFSLAEEFTRELNSPEREFWQRRLRSAAEVVDAAFHRGNPCVVEVMIALHQPTSPVRAARK